ncbi:hypothetical protein DBV15_02678 [Temnothorax longispinosus]|uniref:Uncharacterized protein n=1 Tax=Temnothorax longispinosus TaxID=300112 RepID=A0A4S2KE60_9HYME|nr:hypothetical protein DBV15_02678 [Temnothorax longispinosus]
MPGVAERKDDCQEGGEAGALQEFTRGPVHEHVKVGPGAHRWLPSRMSSTCVNSYIYARVRLIYVYIHGKAAAAGTLEPAQIECRGTLYLASEYPALKPTITLFGSRLSAIPPLRARYTTRAAHSRSVVRHTTQRKGKKPQTLRYVWNEIARLKKSVMPRDGRYSSQISIIVTEIVFTEISRRNGKGCQEFTRIVAGVDYTKSDLIHESGAILKRFLLASTTRSHESIPSEFQRYKVQESHGISEGFAVTLQVVLSIRVSETIKIRRRLQKFLSKGTNDRRHIEFRSDGIHRIPHDVSDWLEGTPKEPRSRKNYPHDYKYIHVN